MSSGGLYQAMCNSDSTEGRGPDKTIGWFSTLEAAVLSVQGRGPMGCSDGTVFAVVVTSDLTQVRANGGPEIRRQAYGWAPGLGLGFGREASCYYPGFGEAVSSSSPVQDPRHPAERSMLAAAAAAA